MKNKSRRTFIKASLTATALTTGISTLAQAAMAESHFKQKIRIQDNDIILFQGDSITHAGRDSKNNDINSPVVLGHGYAFLAAADLLNSHASQKLTIYNRGIGGNKVCQLADRWNRDCLDLKPNILSILIGVNDYWAKLNGTYNGTIQVYRDDYRKLVERTLEKLPDVKLIIGEPFAVNKVKAVTDAWYPAFDEYRQAAEEIAHQYKATFIPYQRVFDKAVKVTGPSYWTPDGVHPSLAGAHLMAEAWMTVVR